MTRHHRLAALLPLGLALVVAACASGGATSSPASGQPASSAPGATVPTPVPDPNRTASPGDVPGSGSGGGGSGGNPGGGVILDPGAIGDLFAPAPPGADGEPTLVTPVAGVRDVHDVSVTVLETAVDGRRVAARVSWWSGVAPCSALAGVDVIRDGTTITLTVREGSAAAPDTACIDLAQYKAAVVDLGELEPGTWRIVAKGDAPPAEVTIAG